jgi:signal transduction histidine kinase
MTTIVSLTAVLLIIFSGIYFSMKYFMKFQAEMILNTVARDEQLSSDYNQSLVRFFFIKMDPSGKTIGFDSDITIPKKDVETLKNIALESKVSNGNISKSSYKFRFLMVPKGYGSIIVFLDYSVEEIMIKPFFISSAFISIITLTLVFIITIFLANKSIQPIKKSWEKQAVFIADASHELRTPLSVVTSNLEIVMENENETVGSQKKWFGNIQSELDRMKKLVDDLLFLARSDSEDEFPKDYFNLSGLLFKIYDSFTLIAKKKGLNLILNNKDNITAYGNEFRIKQLITILLDNAIKYTDYGGKIELILETSTSIYQLSVRDTGEGISKEHINKIFDRFYRVDKSRSRSHGGSGLGLAIAKCIVNEHKGTINIKSEVNKGTEVTISLPIECSK